MMYRTAESSPKLPQSINQQIQSKDTFAQAIKSSHKIQNGTTQYHWHLSTFHSKPFYKHINHGEEASKRRRNHPLEVSLCIGNVSEVNCAWKRTLHVRAAINFNLILSSRSNKYCASASSLSLSNIVGRTKRKSTSLPHRSLTTKVAETRRKLRR